MELLKQENMLTGFLRLDLRAGKYAGLLVRASGTNFAAATSALADLGNIKIQHQNFGERVNASFKFFNERTNLLNGVASNVSAIGAAFDFAAIISFRRRLDKTNILNVRADLKTTLSWDGFAPLAALIASGTLEVYGIYDDTGYQRYLPMIRTQQSAVPAAMTLKEQIPFPFCEELWGENDANIGTIQVLRDGKITVDGAWGALYDWSNAENNIETAVGTVGMVEPHGESPSNIGQTTFQLVSTAALTGNVFTYHYFVCEPVKV
jgi:hypothetical protein